MKIAVVFVYSPVAGGNYAEYYPIRFVESYNANPTQMDHQVVVVCNGVKATSDVRCLFCSLRGCQFLEHDDSGYDIGAYQLAGRTVTCDLLVFLGGSSYIRGPAWLERVCNSVSKYGDSIYGATGNTGDPRFAVVPHIRTTGWWIRRDTFNAYPYRITDAGQRYQFEHGTIAITQWMRKRQKRAWVVGWRGEYPLESASGIIEGFHRGNQTDVIFGDRLTEPPFYPTA